MSINPLKHEKLRTYCNPNQLGFETTADLKKQVGIVGQYRAIEAIRFGIAMEKIGYNICALGPHGVGKHSIVQEMLKQSSAGEIQSVDWCYVYNFDAHQAPLPLRLPAGFGVKLCDDMNHLVNYLKTAIPATFESKEYQNCMQQIEKGYEKRKKQIFDALKREAKKENIAIVDKVEGFEILPIHDDKIVSLAAFQELPEEEQERDQKKIKKCRVELEKVLDKITRWAEEVEQNEQAASQELINKTVVAVIQPLQEKYASLENVIKYLARVKENIVLNAQDFYPPEENSNATLADITTEKNDPIICYKVNLIIDHSRLKEIPIIYEPNPTFPNLVGRFERMLQFGTVVTDFTLIRAGALHRANGGYLILDMHRLLSHPYAWEGLKRSLYSQQIKISALEEMLGTPSSITLEPAPISLDVKIILLGDRELYQTLCVTDPDFKELFKVVADFEEEMKRNFKNEQLYAQLIVALINKESLRPFHKSAVALLIEHSSKLLGDAQRLTTHYRGIVDLLCEVDFFAGKANHVIAEVADVKQAIKNQINRVNYERDRLYDEIERDFILVETQGDRVGQVNGISTIQLGDFEFGEPSRITATACFGEEEVLDIEREVELGEAMHSKGVLILSGFLRGLYARDRSLSLSASLVFEQSYGSVEGDSASMAELCALLSAISDIPIKQSFAITGSVDQHGQAQAVGSVNEKIEGFFDLCKLRGLTGEQGVLIPEANVKQLMLREDVVSAAANNQFHVYSFKDVDQAISILTGITAGKRNKEGKYPVNSFNFKVEKMLLHFAELAKKKTED